MAGSDAEDRLGVLVRSRILNQKDEIEHSLKQIAAGNPLGAEPSSERRLGRLMRKTNLSARDAESMSMAIDSAASAIDSGREDIAGAEAILGPTIDYVGVEFLTRGRTNEASALIDRSLRWNPWGNWVAKHYRALIDESTKPQATK